MGMYTEFYFRANVHDCEVADWLHHQINGEGRFDYPFNGHEFFTLPRWCSIFRRPIFRRKAPIGGPYGNELAIASSLKNYSGETDSFIDWITPYLDMSDGDFLGYSLYEDSCDYDELYREHPVLYFHRREAVHS